MNHRLQDLYDLPPQELYLLELVEQCARLEARLIAASAEMSDKDRRLIESYIELKDELEFQSVKRALKFSRKKPWTNAE